MVRCRSVAFACWSYDDVLSLLCAKALFFATWHFSSRRISGTCDFLWGPASRQPTAVKPTYSIRTREGTFTATTRKKFPFLFLANIELETMLAAYGKDQEGQAGPQNFQQKIKDLRLLYGAARASRP